MSSLWGCHGYCRRVSGRGRIEFEIWQKPGLNIKRRHRYYGIIRCFFSLGEGNATFAPIHQAQAFLIGLKSYPEKKIFSYIETPRFMAGLVQQSDKIVVRSSGQRESIDSRLPTEPCVRVRTRLLMLLLSIDQDQTNVSSCRSILFPGPVH